MRNKKILKILLDLDLTQAAIARDLGVTPKAINFVIHYQRKSPRLRRGIAQILGKGIEELWPEDQAA